MYNIIKKMKIIYKNKFYHRINMTCIKSVSSVNDYIENKITANIPIYKKKNMGYQNLDDLDDLNGEITNFEDEINVIKNNSYSKYSNNQPKNYGNLWTGDERKIILKYLKKNDYSKINNCSSLYDESIIKKIAKKTERSESGIKEEIKKMIFNDYIWNFDTYSKLSQKYNIPEHNIKILIKIYLEKYGEKILYPIEIENKILKFQVENIKLKLELRELVKVRDMGLGLGLGEISGIEKSDGKHVGIDKS